MTAFGVFEEETGKDFLLVFYALLQYNLRTGQEVSQAAVRIAKVRPAGRQERPLPIENERGFHSERGSLPLTKLIT